MFEHFEALVCVHKTYIFALYTHTHTPTWNEVFCLPEDVPALFPIFSVGGGEENTQLRRLA